MQVVANTKIFIDTLMSVDANSFIKSIQSLSPVSLGLLLALPFAA